MRFLFPFAFLWAGALPAYAPLTVRLTWDGSLQAASYRVYWTTNKQWTTNQFVPVQGTNVVFPLPDPGTYVFRATALAADPVEESEPSNMVSYRTPARAVAPTMEIAPNRE